MKKITIIFIAIIGLGLLISCKKELREPVLDMNLTEKAAITNPADGSSYVLTNNEADSVFTNFQWSAVKYNLDDLEATKYALQMDIADSNFINARNLVTTTNTSFEITVGAMNQRLIGMGLAPDTAHNVEFRIFAYINDDTDYSDVYSNPITLTVTPFEPPSPTTPSLWIPGDYQGWDPANAPQIYSYTNDGVFKGYMYMPEGGTYEFKFTSAPDWNHTNFGYAGEDLLDTDPEAGNLSVEGPGGYSVVVDTVALTWTHDLENWGVIGEWLDWAEDIDMLWDAENQYLYVTVEDIPAAENQRFKFRANDSWDVNLGAKDPDDGTLVQGGADIPIPDGGTLKFILIFTTAEPTYEVHEN